ncbi:bacteriocin fulvocin C-related protein [Streptomyces sp. NPDC049744]|uniref:bacteriocin fulvocin C-related protein n=1 Tax=Streptomyces sp. NPDC049744 TaxID=3154359 RepID=UPI0034404E51
MSGNDVRWVLAFDASCGACRNVASRVSDAVGDRLEILPLNHPEVRAWRETALGSDPVWKPTLLKIDGSSVRGWTGSRMSIPLTRRLGAAPTLRVLQALGEMSRTGSATGKTTDGIPRKRFLTLAAGTVAAGGLVLTGRTPAAAAPATQNADVEAWLERNKHNLPTRYAEVTTYTVPYRRAIYTASTPETRSNLWREHLTTYRSSHPALTTTQRNAIDEAITTLTATTLFSQKPEPGNTTDRSLQKLKKTVIKAFGEQEAKALIAHLGPTDEQTTAAPNCGCAVADSWCGGTCSPCCHDQLGCNCGAYNCCCHLMSSGCGSLWEYICDGVCFD